MRFANSPVHLMRLGVHAEQKYFINNKDKYDLVVFNANLAHYFSKGTASLIAGKLGGTPFIIDPITHAFGHNLRYIKTDGPDPKVKTSLSGLAREYGSPISTAVQRDHRVEPSDFKKEADYIEFSKQVLTFQSDGLFNAHDPSDTKYYLEDPKKILEPLFLIAPYFYMKRSNYEEWLPVNIELVKVSRKQIGEKKIFAEIVFDRRLLERPEEYGKILEAYLGLNECDGYLIWISDLAEHDSALSTLVSYKDFVSKLSKSGKPIYNLYGGYFSILMLHFGLAGVCHGPGYGEDRDVIPVGGGMPTSKFYLTPVHQRMLFREVQYMVNKGAWESLEDYFSEVCSGQICKEVLSDGLDSFYRFGIEIVREKTDGRSYSYPTPESKDLTVYHYLEAKKQEFDEVISKDLGNLINQLKEAKFKYDGFFPGSQFGYLDNWIDALK